MSDAPAGVLSPTGSQRPRATAVTAAIALLPVLFLAIFFLAPVAALVRRALNDSAGEGFGSLLARADVARLLWSTVAQAGASTVVTMVVAAPLVWLAAVAGPRRYSLVMVAVTVPFVMPTVVVGIAFRALFSPGGPLGGLGWDGSLLTILAAHAFLNVAVVVRVVGSAWRNLDPRPEQVARTLGASPMRAFTSVVAPRLVVPLVSAAGLVFLFCSTSFGVVLILGNGGWQTLETAVYTQAIGYFDLPAAVAVSMVQILLVVVVVALTRVPIATASAAVRDSVVAPVRGMRAVVVELSTLWLVLVVLGPIAVVVVRSVRPTTGGAFTWAGYRSLARSINGDTPLATLRYGAVSAVWATVAAVAVGLLAAVALHRASGFVGTIASVIAMVPLGVSAVTVGFGYLILLASLPRAVADWPGVVPAVQAVVAVPVVIRVLGPAIQAVPTRLREAAATLGASGWRVWCTVDFPIIRRAVVASAAFAYIIALGEFGATGFVARPGTTTLPVLIGSALNRPGADNLATAMAASVLLIAATAVAVAVMELARGVEASAL
ncbi:iron ABC transporter permease [Williamsia sp. CHRR-6]|uniref:ABC transporter permease n=1 Tax=Williamsia sp. CHRR-6 TaxID=2835871 RepID=UPI001BDA4C5E|nr:ABC transporter permease subunit [Williamsia sp. CHRR-6]MBT0565537.1 iron ABC transporter permease [Williamsia sp. CHRR-6]